MKLTNN